MIDTQIQVQSIRDIVEPAGEASIPSHEWRSKKDVVLHELTLLGKGEQIRLALFTQYLKTKYGGTTESWANVCYKIFAHGKGGHFGIDYRKNDEGVSLARTGGEW
jgi:hypothetical protein